MCHENSHKLLLTEKHDDCPVRAKPAQALNVSVTGDCQRRYFLKVRSLQLENMHSNYLDMLMCLYPCERPLSPILHGLVPIIPFPELARQLK